MGSLLPGFKSHSFCHYAMCQEWADTVSPLPLQLPQDPPGFLLHMVQVEELGQSLQDSSQER